MTDDMDINCGEIVDGGVTVQDTRAEDLRADAAGGQRREHAQRVSGHGQMTNSCPGSSAR
jgi:altronate dehydratase